ncbi:MAG: response regulator transcription factor [Defluviitaleaceae bacterium]|nr:response regulator transcription factor [Defluviitaleaceae bacterium]
MKLLIVEDDPSLQSALYRGFHKLGFLADAASDGEEALDLFFSNNYALVVLDLNIPILQGMDVLSKIREENKDIPVLILSARSELEDKIEGLDRGANDYLAKPFHFAELEARVRALLRRNFKTGDSVIEIGNIKVDTSARKLFVSGKELELAKKEYRIIEHLCLRRGETVSATEIIESIWETDAEHVHEALKVHICNLRKKIPEGFIRNRRGLGYYVE